MKKQVIKATLESLRSVLPLIDDRIEYAICQAKIEILEVILEAIDDE